MISLRFFSPPEKPFVEVAVDERGIHSEPLHPVHRGESQFEDRQVDALAGGLRLPEELDHRDAGDLLGVLEGEEHAGLGPLVGRPLGDVVAEELDRPGGDLVLGRAHQRAAEGRLAGSVRAHDGVHLAGVHREIEAPQDLGALGDQIVRRRPHVQARRPGRACRSGRSEAAPQSRRRFYGARPNYPYRRRRNQPGVRHRVAGVRHRVAGSDRCHTSSPTLRHATTSTPRRPRDAGTT